MCRTFVITFFILLPICEIVNIKFRYLVPTMTIGNRVLQILNEKNLKQKDLADHLGTKPSTINGWHEENRNPSSDLIVPICEFLGVSAYFLLTGNEDPMAGISDDDREWLDLIHGLSPEVQRDFKGAMRLHADLHDIADREEKLRQEKAQALSGTRAM